MPPAQGSSLRRAPIASPSIRRAASTNETSVKTAIEKGRALAGFLEAKHVPHAFARRAARRDRSLREVARAVAGEDFVARHVSLRSDRHLLQLAANPQLLDAGATVVDDGALDD